MRSEAQFLLDRLDEYDPEDADHVRDFHGHVAPAIARLRYALQDPAPKERQMAEEKMTLIEQLQNPPRVDGGGLDEDKVIDLMRAAAEALSTMIGVASKLAAIQLGS